MHERTLSLRLLALCFAIIAGANVGAQNSPAVTLDFTDNTSWKFPTTKTQKAGTYTNAAGYSVSLSKNTTAGWGYNFWTSGDETCLLMGKTNTTLTLPKFSFAVSKIEVTFTSQSSTSAQTNFFVGSTAVSTAVKGGKDNTYNIAANYQAAGNQYVFKVLSEHNVQIMKILIYGVADEKQDCGLAFGLSSYTGLTNKTYEAGRLLINPHNLPVTYSVTCSPAGVATVDASTGVLTTSAVEGTVTYTASFAGNDTYKAGAASFTLHVSAPKQDTDTGQDDTPTDGTATFDIASGKTYGSGLSPQDGNDYEMGASTWTSGQVTMQVSGTYRLYKSGATNVTDLRLYYNHGNQGHGQLTFTAPEGGKITAINITGQNLGQLETTSTRAANDETTKQWSGNANSVTFTHNSASGTVQISNIVVTYTTPQPTSETVTIGATGYATIYYGAENLLVPQGVTANTYKVADGRLAVSHTYESGTVIPQGTAVVISGAPGSYTFVVTQQEGTADADNMLRGTDTNAVTTGGDVYYALQLNSNSDPGSVGFYYKADDGAAFTNAAHKAYLALAQSVEVKAFYLLSGEDEATKITAPSSENFGAAEMKIYSTTGKLLPHHGKGIYVVNGKKVLFR